MATTSVSRAAYPDRPVTVIVPFAAGSAVDIVARVIATHLSQDLNEPFIIQDRPGGDGLIGLSLAANAKPDGYTLLISGGAETKSPALHRKLPYDPIQQIAPIAALGSTVYLIGVNTKLGTSTLAELIGLLKSAPGKFNAAVSGNSTRLALELFQMRAGVRVETVAFAGTAQVATSLLSGETDFAVMDGLGFSSIINLQTIRLLAVAGDKRLDLLPNLPTTEEAGLKDYQTGTTFGIYATGGTPAAIVQQLNLTVNNILRLKDVDQTLAPLGLNLPKGENTVSWFNSQYLADLTLWKNVVLQAGIKAN